MTENFLINTTPPINDFNSVGSGSHWSCAHAHMCRMRAIHSGCMVWRFAYYSIIMYVSYIGLWATGEQVIKCIACYSKSHSIHNWVDGVDFIPNSKISSMIFFISHAFSSWSMAYSWENNWNKLNYNFYGWYISH